MKKYEIKNKKLNILSTFRKTFILKCKIHRNSRLFNIKNSFNVTSKNKKKHGATNFM